MLRARGARARRARRGALSHGTRAWHARACMARARATRAIPTRQTRAHDRNTPRRRHAPRRTSCRRTGARARRRFEVGSFERATEESAGTGSGGVRRSRYESSVHSSTCQVDPPPHCLAGMERTRGVRDERAILRERACLPSARPATSAFRSRATHVSSRRFCASSSAFIPTPTTRPSASAGGRCEIHDEQRSRTCGGGGGGTYRWSVGWSVGRAPPHRRIGRE